MQHSNKKLLLVVLVFILPIIASWLLYYFHAQFHFRTVNHGVLIQPAIDGQAIKTEKKWQILYVYHQNCSNQCVAMLHELGQVQKALGKNYARVQVIKLNDQAPAFVAIRTSLNAQMGNDFQVADKVYLVDPIGNIFMYYPATTDPIYILNDLKKVLEVSQIG